MSTTDEPEITPESQAAQHAALENVFVRWALQEFGHEGKLSKDAVQQAMKEFDRVAQKVLDDLTEKDLAEIREKYPQLTREEIDGVLVPNHAPGPK